MQRITDDEQLRLIWDRVDEQNIDTTRTRDLWDEEITIFEGWGDVDKVASIIFSVLPAQMVADQSTDPHHIEWAIGDFSFSDQYSTCSHCNRAVDVHDGNPEPRYWYDDTGDMTCDICMRDNADFQSDYLTFVAAHLGGNSYDQWHPQIAYAHMADPSDHGYLCLNPMRGSHKYSAHPDADFLDKLESKGLPIEDHPDWSDHWFTWGIEDSANRFGRAARLIDPALQIVPQWDRLYSTTVLYWVRWDENNTPSEDDPITSRAILLYAVSRAIAKYGDLLRRGK